MAAVEDLDPHIATLTVDHDSFSPENVHVWVRLHQNFLWKLDFLMEY